VYDDVVKGCLIGLWTAVVRERIMMDDPLSIFKGGWVDYILAF
jgi:hypothetical protein